MKREGGGIRQSRLKGNEKNEEERERYGMMD